MQVIVLKPSEQEQKTFEYIAGSRTQKILPCLKIFEKGVGEQVYIGQYLVYRQNSIIKVVDI